MLLQNCVTTAASRLSSRKELQRGRPRHQPCNQSLVQVCVECVDRVLESCWRRGVSDVPLIHRSDHMLELQRVGGDSVTPLVIKPLENIQCKIKLQDDDDDDDEASVGNQYSFTPGKLSSNKRRMLCKNPTGLLLLLSLLLIGRSNRTSTEGQTCCLLEIWFHVQEVTRDGAAPSVSPIRSSLLDLTELSESVHRH